MIDSPRRRILTQIGHIDPPKQENHPIIHKSMQSLDRVSRVFKMKPTHAQRASSQRSGIVLSPVSKINQNIDCLDSLNVLFRARKITQSKSFFENQQNRKETSVGRSKQKINEDIQSSIQFISNIKRQKNLFIESPNFEAARLYQKVATTKVSSMIGAIGLDFPGVQTKRQHRFMTEPSICNQIKNEKGKEHGLYSYLEREFVEKRKNELTQGSMIDYAKNPANKKFHRLVLQKSRKFLKGNMQKNNYRFLGEISEVVTSQSKKIIEEDIKEAKKKFTKEYLDRNSIPYFSFLSLTEKEKQSVLETLNRKKSFS